jgi:lysophospholipase L1-like esterase
MATNLRRLIVSAALAASALSILTAAGTDAAISTPASRDGGAWVGTWATGDQPLGQIPIANATLREIVHVSAGGSAVRVRLDNTYGSGPLTFADARVGLAGAGAAVLPGTDRALTFGGDAAVTVAQGAHVLSDEVRLGVPAQADLAVSLFLPGGGAPVTGHHNAKQASFVSTAGDHAADLSPAPFATQIFDWYWLDGIDVLSSTSRGAVVAVGDSITNGAVSTFDANNRWPDFLARRLLRAEPRERPAVLNTGIDGAELLAFRTDCCPAQEAGLALLERDVIAQTGATHAIVLLGTNDLGFGVQAGPIASGLRQIVARLHAKGIEVVAGTVPPFQGSVADPAGRNDAARDALNRFVRTSGAFDGVADFDLALRDPANPERLLPAFDSGDHLHPNDAGDRAMADAVDLALLR